MWGAVLDALGVAAIVVGWCVVSLCVAVLWGRIARRKDEPVDLPACDWCANAAATHRIVTAEGYDCGVLCTPCSAGLLQASSEGAYAYPLAYYSDSL